LSSKINLSFPEPFIFLGVHEFNPKDVKVGDVVVYDAAWYNQPVIHRVINITNINGTTMYMIKGDNNNAPDPYYVTKGQIESKVVTFGDNLVVIPKIGYLSLWLRGL
jgi:signal peptidase